MTDLACLANITPKLNILRLELQGWDKYVADEIITVNTFKSKVLLWTSYLV
jgi:hypothetical protein